MGGEVEDDEMKQKQKQTAFPNHTQLTEHVHNQGELMTYAENRYTTGLFMTVV